MDRALVAPHAPARVVEPVLVVEGDEEPKDGEEHDDVAREHQAAGAPLDLERQKFR